MKQQSPLPTPIRLLPPGDTRVGKNRGRSVARVAVALDHDAQGIRACFIVGRVPMIFMSSLDPDNAPDANDSLDARVLDMLGPGLTAAEHTKEPKALVDQGAINPCFMLLCEPHELPGEMQFGPELSREGLRLMNGDYVPPQNMEGYVMGVFFRGHSEHKELRHTYIDKCKEIFTPSKFIDFALEDPDVDEDDDPWVMPFVQIPEAVIDATFKGLLTSEEWARWYLWGRLSDGEVDR